MYASTKATTKSQGSHALAPMRVLGEIVRKIPRTLFRRTPFYVMGAVLIIPAIAAATKYLREDDEDEMPKKKRARLQKSHGQKESQSLQMIEALEPSLFKAIFPYDVFEQITKHIPESLHSQHLYNLCLTSRNFCSVAQPFMYQKYYQSWVGKVEARPLRSFLRTLCARPDLTVEVNFVHLVDNEPKAFHSPRNFSRPDHLQPQYIQWTQMMDARLEEISS